MILSRILRVTGLMKFGWGTVFAQLLPLASDDVKLRARQEELVEDAADRTEKAHAEALASQFKIEPSVVENLRSSKQGGGEIVIRLGLAQDVTKTDPKTYPTRADAMQKVEDLRIQNMAWGTIAKDLGFTVGPVVSEVQRVRQEIRAETKKTATEGVVTPGQSLERSQTETASHSDRAEKAQRPK